MIYHVGLALLLLLSATNYADADNEFCHRGFQIAGKYHECWESATYANRYRQLYEPQEVYTPKFLEDYATHMCSVVKPKALDCFKKEVAECSNADKLVGIANESGGACVGYQFNPFFKQHIIDNLKPVSGDSPCFTISDSSYECYVSAGEQIMQSGMNTVDISRFHKVADKFFTAIWDCLILVFKSNEEICEDWQLPMLMALQKTAMPSLFGMRLNNEQVAKLELEKNVTGNVLPPKGGEDNGEETEGRSYLLLQLFSTKPQNTEGGVLLQIDSAAGSEPSISVAGGHAKDAQDVSNFIGEIIGGDSKAKLKEIRKIRKERRRKNKEIKNYVEKINNSDGKKKDNNKKGGSKGQGKKGDKDNSVIENNLDDMMID